MPVILLGLAAANNWLEKTELPASTMAVFCINDLLEVFIMVVLANVRSEPGLGYEYMKYLQISESEDVLCAYGLIRKKSFSASSCLCG